MTDSAETMREALAALTEPEESDAYDNLEGALIDIKRLSANGKPTDHVCIRTIERVQEQILKATKIMQAALSATKSDGGAEVASSASPATRGEQRDRTHGTMPVGGNAENSARTDRSPSDPIPSQPDERERVKQVIESAMIEEAEIQYADFTDRDRQREKIIANAADAILAMQAERRDDERN